MHCDFAFFVGATADNTKDLAELERLPGCAGIKLFMGSSTGSLLVAGGRHESKMNINPMQRAHTSPRCSAKSKRTGKRLDGIRQESSRRRGIARRRALDWTHWCKPLFFIRFNRFASKRDQPRSS
jgi:hypothetical protein